MSTNSECEFIESEPSKWYYLLEDYHAPKNAWDWREYATAYGPFSSQEQADAHLADNHANPGGYMVSPFDGKPMDKTVTDLLSRATKPQASRYRFG